MINCISNHHWGLRYFAGYPNLSLKYSGKGIKYCFHLDLLISFLLNHLSPICGNFVSFAMNFLEMTKHRFTMWETFSLNDMRNCQFTSTLFSLNLMKNSLKPILLFKCANYVSMSSRSLPTDSNIHKGAILATLSW